MCAFSPPVAAQTAPPSGVILGRVVEAGTDRGVAGAVVRLTVADSTAAAPIGPPGAAPAMALAAAAARPAARPNAMTDGSGYFLFREVPTGSYTITVHAAGFLPALHGQRRPDGPPRTVQVDTARTPTDVTISAWRPGAIEGTLRDEHGDPVVGAAVRAMRRESHPTGARLVMAVTVNTDDRGLYRLAPLPPGAYVVVAPSNTTSMSRSLAAQLANAYMSMGNSGSTAGRPQVMWNMSTSGSLISPEGIDAGTAVIQVPLMPTEAMAVAPRPAPDGALEVYRTTLHPAATSLSAAGVVNLGPGELRTGVDIALELTRSFRVSGRLSVTDGPSADQVIHLLPRDSRAAGADPDFAVSVTLSEGDGRFTLRGVPPGDYRLAVLRFGRPPNFPGEGEFAAFNLRTLWADMPVTVTDRDIAGLVVPVADGIPVTGRVAFEGTQPPAAAIQKTVVSLVPVDRTESGVYGLSVPADSTGTFTTMPYPPGRYAIDVRAVSAEWIIKSISVAGKLIADTPIALAADADGRDVVVTLTTRTAALSGVVRATSILPDAVVVLMPRDVERWIANGLPSARFRTVAAGDDGRFRIDRLIAGDYLAAAIGTGTNMDVGDAATVRALAAAATAVRIVEGVDATVTLPISQVR